MNLFSDLQASLIVTEELHLITFETEVYHQGLKIDLEVRDTHIHKLELCVMNHSLWSAIKRRNLNRCLNQDPCHKFTAQSN